MRFWIENNIENSNEWFGRGPAIPNWNIWHSICYFLHKWIFFCTRQRSLCVVLRVYQCINTFPDKRLRVDTFSPQLQGVCIMSKGADFWHWYPDAEEEIDHKLSLSGGKCISKGVCFDSNYDTKTFRSINGLSVFIRSLQTLQIAKR